MNANQSKCKSTTNCTVARQIAKRSFEDARSQAGAWEREKRENGKGLGISGTLGAKLGIRVRIMPSVIDVTDLGYTDGEAVEGLFLRDDANDERLVDQVFIGGFPDVRGE